VIDGGGGKDPRVDDPLWEPAEADATEAVEEGEPYFPPTDPVIEPGPDPKIVGGFSETAMSGEAPPPHAETGGPADEALAARVRRELREDAATAHLRLHVTVRDGIATLRGEVNDLDDLDNALAVAGRVPGIVDVVDELKLPEVQPDSSTRGSRPIADR
jgi:hypothetical protein